jgi:hypothetical protein
VVKNFDLDKFLRNLLTTHLVDAHYTSIVHLCKKKDTVIGQKYIWAHINMRPWRHLLLLLSIIFQEEERECKGKDHELLGLQFYQRPTKCHYLPKKPLNPRVVGA